MAKRRKSEEGPARLYRIKVTLARVRPPVWRRVVVRSDATLGDLHRIVQAAMGWTDTHLHLFEFGEARYSGESEFGGVDLEEMDCEDEERVTLGEVLGKTGSKFRYEYDFGDGWDHQCLIEEVTEAPPGSALVVCVGGRRACPPEDCGGPWGYAQIVELVMKPEMPDPEGVREWLEGFDPEAFDAAEVSRELGEMFRGR